MSSAMLGNKYGGLWADQFSFLTFASPDTVGLPFPTLSCQSTSQVRIRVEIRAAAQPFTSKLDASHLKLEIPTGLRGTHRTKLFHSLNPANIVPLPHASKSDKDAVFSITDYLPQTQMLRRSCGRGSGSLRPGSRQCQESVSSRSFPRWVDQRFSDIRVHQNPP